jgi:hypothetical protein
MMNLIDKIESYPNKSKLAVLIRHADRDKIPEGEFGNEVLLNENGVKNSIQFGEKIKNHRINAIYSSPVERCIQTANNIVKGYCKQIEIIETVALGGPGMHVLDADLVGQYYLENGFWEMYKNFKNGVAIQGLPQKEKLKEDFYNFLNSNTKEEGITIYITHDSLIAFVAFVINGKEYTEGDWIDYLDGLILKID